MWTWNTIRCQYAETPTRTQQCNNVVQASLEQAEPSPPSHIPADAIMPLKTISQSSFMKCNPLPSIIDPDWYANLGLGHQTGGRFRRKAVCTVSNLAGVSPDRALVSNHVWRNVKALSCLVKNKLHHPQSKSPAVYIKALR